MSAKEYLSGVDKSFFAVEGEGHPMTIASAWVFHERVELASVLEEYEKMTEQFPRLRMKVSEPTLAWWPAYGRYWESYDFNLAQHVTEVHVAEEDGSTEEDLLKGMVADLYGKPWDFTRALWHSYLIHYGQDKSMLYTQLHHCITDGQGCIRCLLSVTKGVSDASSEQHGTHQPRPARQGPVDRLIGHLPAILHSGATQFTHQISQLLLVVLGTFYMWYNLLGVLFFFHRRNMRGQLTPQKSVSYVDDIDLGRIKLIKDHFGVTVNDVILSSLAGSYREYIAQREGQVKDKDLLSYIPISMRAVDDWTLGNKVTAMWLRLPLDMEHPIQRLYEVQRRMNALKKTPEPMGLYFWNDVMGRLPFTHSQLLKPVSDWILRKPHTFEVSNH
jgi:diacylglycerol O-acyltransferase / wax synthase